ncbi:hypothetical protein Tco_1533495 [Tanacetum coccineum]
MCIPFTGIAQFPDVAHNLEILQDQEDCDESERSGKKQDGSDNHRNNNQDSGNNDKFLLNFSLQPLGDSGECLHVQKLLQARPDWPPPARWQEGHCGNKNVRNTSIRTSKYDIEFGPEQTIARSYLSHISSHVVLAEGITMDPAKVEVVTKWPRSTSETEARSFLGLAGHYHRVVEGSSRLALPLTKLTRKDEKLYGPESERRSLKNLSNV